MWHCPFNTCNEVLYVVDTATLRSDDTHVYLERLICGIAHLTPALASSITNIWIMTDRHIQWSLAIWTPGVRNTLFK